MQAQEPISWGCRILSMCLVTHSRDAGDTTGESGFAGTHCRDVCSQSHTLVTPAGPRLHHLQLGVAHPAGSSGRDQHQLWRLPGKRQAGRQHVCTQLLCQACHVSQPARKEQLRWHRSSLLCSIAAIGDSNACGSLQILMDTVVAAASAPCICVSLCAANQVPIQINTSPCMAPLFPLSLPAQRQCRCTC